MHSDMTLLDYFAAHALAGMMADPDCCHTIGEGTWEEHTNTIASEAYDYARAMLAAKRRIDGPQEAN